MLELIGADDSPGVKEGGVLEQVTRELTIEALPTDIPDSLKHDVSEMEIGDTLTLAAVSAPARRDAARRPRDGDRDAHAAAAAGRGGAEIEEETELVGEGEARAAARRSARAHGGELPPAATATRPARRRPAHRPARGPVDWLIVGLGNPGSEYAGTPPQRRLRGRERARARAGSCRSRRASTAAC